MDRGMEVWRYGGGMEGGREGWRDGGREGWREVCLEGGMEGGREEHGYKEEAGSQTSKDGKIYLDTIYQNKRYIVKWKTKVIDVIEQVS